jgi:hypothetical protein
MQQHSHYQCHYISSASTLQVGAETTQNPPINRKATRNRAKTTGYISGNSLEIHGKFIHLHQKTKSATASSRSAVWPPQSSVKVTD